MAEFTLDQFHPPKPDSVMQQSMALLARYMRPQWIGVLLLALLLSISIALQLLNPQVIRYFLDTAQSGGPERALLTAAALYIAFALSQQIVGIATTYVGQNVSWAATNRLRADLALHCLRLDMTFHKRRTPGELIERIDGDVTQLANFFSEFTIRVLGNGLLVVGILILLFLEDPRIGVGLAVYCLATLAALSAIQRIAVSRWAAERQASAEQAAFLEERISGAEDIRASGADPYAMRQLYVLMRNFLEKSRVAFLVSSLTYNITNLLFVVGYAAGLVIGVYLYTRGQATIGTAYLITFYIGMLAEPLQSLRAQVQDLQQASASIQRIQELFHLQPSVRDRAGSFRQAPRLDPHPLSVEFRDVSFRYETNENVLCGVSFFLEPGKVLGILGRTGSGKSTLTRLFFRLYDPTGGAVLLDGEDLRDLTLSELRRSVGMVTQDVQLFQASVRDNLAFFSSQVHDEQIQAVLQELRLWEWAQSLPEGLDTLLAAGGQGLSAGEAQLLAFTRVFLKDPGLVILDEASSRLDPATENLLERAIDRLFRNRTGVVIAHRLQTVQRADYILILEDGEVVEYGPRMALAADPGSRFSGLLRTGLEEALA